MFLKVLNSRMMNEMQPLASEKGRFVLQEKSDNSQLLAISVHKVRDALPFSSNVIIKGSSADAYMLIETKLITEIKKVVSKTIDSVHHDGSYKHGLLENFPISRFLSDEPNTILESRIAIHQ